MTADVLASVLTEQEANERSMALNSGEGQQREPIPISNVNFNSSFNHKSNHLLVATPGSERGRMGQEILVNSSSDGFAVRIYRRAMLGWAGL